jgi:hypothetical protein
VSQSDINTNWGKVSVKVQRIKSHSGKQTQIYDDASLDESGWSPEALDRLIDLAGRVPYEEASLIAGKFGLVLSRTLVNDLSHAYAKSCQQEVSDRLMTESMKEPFVAKEQVTARVLKPSPQDRVMILQVDGVYVLGQAQAGECPGMELKTAVLYPQNNPGERWMIADKCSPEAFLPQLAGLLKKADIHPHHTLLGLGDGASWVEQTLDCLCDLRITDVYHATDYLDTIMQAMNWTQDIRTYHRKQWLKGQVNARDWLHQHLPDPDIWLAWDDQADTARSYLEARLDAMDYLDFSAKGFPIGSGQIEAMNKSVIGTRMKRSGMHWSVPGAKAMASLRAQISAKHSLIDFHYLRFKAFPVIDFSP